MTCGSGYYLLANGTCTSVCSDGWYVSQGKYCLPCGAYCEVCTSDSACQTCLSDYSLYQSRCYPTCPIGYYSNTTTHICTPCSTNCRTCTSSTQCTECQTPYALNTTTNLCTSCISGYFFSSSTSSCQICSSNCLLCQAAEGTCTKCSEPLFLLGSKCVDTCPTGYYGNTAPAIHRCDLCDGIVPNCANCIPNGCLQCKDPFYLQPVTNSPSYSCVATCSAGYYPDTANMICLKCDTAYCS